MELNDLRDLAGVSLEYGACLTFPVARRQRLNVDRVGQRRISMKAHADLSVSGQLRNVSTAHSVTNFLTIRDSKCPPKCSGYLNDSRLFLTPSSTIPADNRRIF